MHRVRVRFRSAIGVVLVPAALTLVVCGCQAPLHESRQFPSTWPGSQPLSENAPTVSVLPILIEGMPTDPRASDAGGLPTAAVLSALFVKYLHVNGVNAILEPAENTTAQYILQCTVPHLGYEVQEGYPKGHRYQAEMTCTLKDGQTLHSVWQRRLDQRYDETTLLNLMTKLPRQPHQEDRTLYRECIVPLWDAMAQSVGTVVVSRQKTVSNASRQAP